MPDKIVNHFVLADGSVARYDYDGLLNAPDVEAIKNFEPVSIEDWEQGGFDLSNGNLAGSAIRVRTSNYYLPANCKMYFVANGQKYDGCVYSVTGTFERRLFSGYQTSDGSVSFETAKLIAVTAGKTDDSAITPNDVLVEVSADYPLTGAVNKHTEDISKIQSDVEDYIDYNLEKALGLKKLEFESGGISLDVSPVDITRILPSANVNHCVVPCEQGDMFTIFGSGGASYRLFAFIDNSGNKLLVSGDSVPAIEVGRFVIAPENTSYLVVHQKVSEGLPSFYGDARYTKPVMSNLIGQTVITYEKWEPGHINITTGENIDLGITRIRTKDFVDLKKGQTLTVKANGQKYNVFVYSVQGVFESAFPTWQTDDQIFSYDGDKKVRLACAPLADCVIGATDMGIDVFISIPMDGAETTQTTDENIKVFSNATGNCSIKCAKEQMYSDGTPPKIEYYLLEEPVTHDFYISKDLKHKQYAFTFDNTSYKYSIGIMPNGDVIAVQVADTLGNNKKDDSQRTNPFVWLASENWETKHVVDFGSSLKPCGWLMNCGFRTMPDGSAVFCEYTRMTVATANVWKLSGDITNASNWVNTKQFQVTTTDNNNGFKHCHTIQYDFYEDVVYLSTGDSNEGAYMFYSTDRGSTWTTLLSNSEKYCRNLNFVFTDTYIYWTTDNAQPTTHYVFRAERDANGVLDVSNIEDYVNIPNGGATYGTILLPEISTLVLLDRMDGNATTMPFHVVDLTTDTLVTIGSVESASGQPANIGFRVDFMEYYPRDGVIRLGFGFSSTGLGSTVNYNKGFGNQGTSGNGSTNINNLSLRITKDSTGYNLITNTYYI